MNRLLIPAVLSALAAPASADPSLPPGGVAVLEAPASGGVTLTPCDARGACGPWHLAKDVPQPQPPSPPPPPPVPAGSCLAGAKTVVRPVLAPGKGVRIARPAPGTVFDFQGTRLVAPNTWHLVDIGYAPAGVCVTRAHVVGAMDRALTQYEVKQKPPKGKGFDFAGIAFTSVLPGDHIIENSIVENVEDALYFPRTDAGDPDATLIVRHVLASYIRDDFVEDDGGYKHVVIEDTLLDAGHMGFSSRPGGGAPFPKGRAVTWDVTDSLLGFSCKPDHRSPKGKEAGDNNSDCPDDADGGTSTGGVFKRGRPFTTHWKRVVVKVDGTGAHPTGDQLDFLPENGSTFENVTVVWAGRGAFPGQIKVPGVTVTKDASVWDKARAAWLAGHGCAPDASDCAFLHGAP